jgi:hypothetical protein
MCPTGSAYHSRHETHKTPEGDRIILHNGINRREEIAHPLDVAQTTVVFIVRQKHVFHLLEMYIGANVSKRRVWIRMRDVFSFEKCYVPIGAMDVLFYVPNPN